MLSPLYGWCTEGFETADLQEARRLVEAWSCNMVTSCYLKQCMLSLPGDSRRTCYRDRYEYGQRCSWTSMYSQRHH
jgi:hypothetical protein